MAEDEGLNLAAVRREQDLLLQDAEKTKDKLIEMLDDPAYENLDHRRLKAMESKLDIVLLQGNKIRGKLLAEEVDEGLMGEDTKHWETLEQVVGYSCELCSKLMSTRAVHAKIQTADRILTQLKARRMDSPAKDYSIPVRKISERVSDILESLDNSSLAPDHKLRARAMELEIGVEDMEIVDLILTPGDSKTSLKPKVEPPKMQPIAPPTFSGQQRDWQAFWAAFRDIHDCPKYSNTAKLCYLRQAQKDTSLHQQLCENVSHGDSYEDVVAGLLDQFDRPREDHRIYLENITKMQPVKASRASLMACATSLQSSINGMNRLGQVDIQSIFTTLVEPLLPEKVKAQWEEATVDCKQVPAADKLIVFLRKRAAMPQYADKPQVYTPAERKPYKQLTKSKGSVHVATAAPAQQTETRPASPSKVNSTPQTGAVKTKPVSSPYVCRYSCPLCKEAHYAWGCSAFKDKTVAQRKEHVRQHTLCSNCLKPGHSQGDCKSRYSCQTCEGRHNTLLHSGGTSAVGSVNFVANTSSSSLHKSKLLMTCEVVVTGPSGKSMPVRALLDSGADISSITNKVARHLKLPTLPETVAVTSFGDSAEKVCASTSFTISSLGKKDWNHQVAAVMVDTITGDHPREDASLVKTLPGFKDLVPPDPLFHRPGRIDVLLGADVLPYVQSSSTSPSSIIAVDTVFGHAFMGSYNSTNPQMLNKASIQLVTESESPATLKELSRAITRLWESESPLLTASPHSLDELRVLNEYDLTHKYLSNAGKYQVVLPRRLEKRVLGESKTHALQRYFQNEKAHLKKGTLAQYQAVVQEYIDLDHARPCTEEELQLPCNVSYFLPMHGVVKASSSTTKLRVVFDGSAVTTSGWSFNDTLAVGPMLHPKLGEILIRFRKYRVALTGDISKMYREIMLNPEDQQYHRFWWRPTLDEPVKAYCMSRVTFGVTCSPFLAVKTLQQGGIDFGSAYPNAQQHLNRSFYVDDLLGGADTEQEAIILYQQLSGILEKAGFTLRKYRSNSKKVLGAIPKKLHELMPTKEMVDCHSEPYPKALGVVWDSDLDTISTDVGREYQAVKTKREFFSDTGKTFDIMGWVTPAILPMKVMYQELWQLKLEWNDVLPQSIVDRHRVWREELSILTDVQLPRSYFEDEEALTVCLHGFSDASEKAFGAVVYVRATYRDHSPTCRLVTAKSKVAPLQQRSIPELELCGAVLLASMLETVSEILDIPSDKVHAWCDSTITLCWLHNSPSRYKTYVANRITTATSHFSPNIWLHVPTGDNPADCASRGLSARELRDHDLWWNGPPWLLVEPVDVPRQPQQSVVDAHKNQDAKQRICVISAIASEEWLVNRVRSHHTLCKVTAWVRRAAYNFLSSIHHHPLNKEKHLTVEEVKQASNLLVKRAQRRSYSTEISLLTASPPQELPHTSNILSLHPFMGQEGLLRVGGRISKAPISYLQKHPVMLSSKDKLTTLILTHIHIRLCHCGPTLLCSNAGAEYYIVGVKRLARSICRDCVVCKKIAAKANQQMMGQLPVARLTEAPAFTTCGVGAFPSEDKQPQKFSYCEGIFICVCMFCFQGSASGGGDWQDDRSIPGSPETFYFKERLASSHLF